jgi:catechol 2,3-dioxygenase-like lactoylglutathione lyase family enzyme
MRIAHFSIVVRDYDEAIAWFTQKLGFRLVEDTKLTDVKRWVLVAPPGDDNTSIVLGRAIGAAQEAAVGNQTGGRVGFFLQTGDFRRDHEAFLARGVEFIESPREEEYGTVAIFKDLYGNKWDLIQYKPGAKALGR